MEPNGTNENRGPAVTLCRMGCGFYGSLACDGMCSKCYKDVSKARHESSVTEKMNSQATSASGGESAANSNRGQEDNQSMKFSRGVAAAADAEAAAVENSSAASNLSTGISSAMIHMSITNQDSSLAQSSSPAHHSLRAAVQGGDNSSYCSSNSSNTSATAAAASAAAAEGVDCKQSLTTPTYTDESRVSAEGASDASISDVSASGGSSSNLKTIKKNRCSTCNKKVGLTGFPCRCGGLYCSLHRYSDTHECTFNYKELAQEDIRKNNPVVVSEKIKKI